MGQHLSDASRDLAILTFDNNNYNNTDISKRQINLKSRTGARGGYNQKHAKH